MLPPGGRNWQLISPHSLYENVVFAENYLKQFVAPVKSHLYMVNKNEKTCFCIRHELLFAVANGLKMQFLLFTFDLQRVQKLQTPL